MGVSVLIQSTLRNEYTGLRGVSITKTLRDTPTATIRTVDRAGAFLPAVGNQVEVQDDYGGPTSVLFGGSITEVERIRRNSNIALLETNCTCSGYADRLEKRNAGQYFYTGQTADFILRDILANSLTGDITEASPTGIEAGPVIDSLTLDFPTAREAIQEICNLTGREFYITPQGTLSYFAPNSLVCPMSITTGANVMKLTTRETREDLCNAVILRAANALRDADTETFFGDGSTQSFNVAFPVAATPDIYVGSPQVRQTVGIIGVDTGKDWYWQPGSTEIRQESGDTPLTSGTNMDVTYVGTEPIIITAQNATSISERAAAENNSGIYQKLLNLDTQLTRADAQAVADAYVERHSALSLMLTFETNTILEPETVNLDPGQVITVSISGWNAAGDYLIRTVNLSMNKGDQDPDRWSARVEAVSGPVLRNYVDVFRDLIGGGSVSGLTTGGGGTAVKYHRTLLLKNTAVGTNIADLLPAQEQGTAFRLTGVLRKTITSDLTVRCKLNGVALITLTIPLATAVGVVKESSAFPLTPQPIERDDYFTWDVIASDGQVDAAGVASFTLEWIR